MRNVTITLDDVTARWARVEAARHDTSVSRFLGDMLRREMRDRDDYERARISYAARTAVALTSGSQGYPSRDEVHLR